MNIHKKEHRQHVDDRAKDKNWDNRIFRFMDYTDLCKFKMSGIYPSFTRWVLQPAGQKGERQDWTGIVVGYRLDFWCQVCQYHCHKVEKAKRHEKEHGHAVRLTRLYV